MNTVDKQKTKIRSLESERDALQRELDEAYSKQDAHLKVIEDQDARVRELEEELRETKSRLGSPSSTIHIELELKLSEFERLRNQVCAELNALAASGVILPTSCAQEVIGWHQRQQH